MRKIVIILVSCLVLLVGMLLILSNKEDTTDPTGTEYIAEVVGIDEAKENLATISNDSNPVATIILTQDGVDYTFTFELFPDLAPQSVYNFISLANSDFYTNLTLHRFVQNFVMQGGDPDGTGAGGPDYSILGEFPSNGVETGLTHQVGALAWARSSEANSAGSQFYIVLNDGVQSLDNDYAVFGYMIEGYENLEHFNNITTDANSYPESTVTIKEVSVDTKGQEYPEPDHV